LASKAWHSRPELARTSLDGKRRLTKPNAWQPYGRTGSCVIQKWRHALQSGGAGTFSRAAFEVEPGIGVRE
jgi:hypothetical protein